MGYFNDVIRETLVPQIDRMQGLRWRLSDAIRDRVPEEACPEGCDACMARLYRRVVAELAIRDEGFGCPRCGKPPVMVRGADGAFHGEWAPGCELTPRPWRNQCTLIRDLWTLEAHGFRAAR